MTTASSSSIFTQAATGSPAGIDAWTGELVGQLIACGLTQTNDTGQLTITGSGALATTNAAQPSTTGIAGTVGYVCFTFNDVLAGGNLSTAATQTAGTGETGAFTGTLIGATSGAIANVTAALSGAGLGAITFVSMVSGAFIVGEKLTVHSQSAGGASAGWVGIVTALSSGSPVIFRLDFGGGGAVTDPQMWIAVGQGTNGSGTIAGSAGTTKMTQVACGPGLAPVSIITAYTSYFCYNATYGTCFVGFKFGGLVALNCALGFYLYRSNNSSGAATGTSIVLISNSSTTAGVSGTSSASPVQQSLNYANSAVYPAINATNSTTWCLAANNSGINGIAPYGLTTLAVGSIIYTFPTMYLAPAPTISAFFANALTADIGNGTTVSLVVIGATPITFLSILAFWGGSSGISAPFGGIGVGTNLVVYQ